MIMIDQQDPKDQLPEEIKPVFKEFFSIKLFKLVIIYLFLIIFFFVGKNFLYSSSELT